MKYTRQIENECYEWMVIRQNSLSLVLIMVIREKYLYKHNNMFIQFRHVLLKYFETFINQNMINIHMYVCTMYKIQTFKNMVMYIML